MKGTSKAALKTLTPPLNPKLSPEAWREIQLLADALGDVPDSTVLLLGSVARGEIAEGFVNGRREVFSDYEFLVVTKKRLPADKCQALKIRATEIAQRFDYRNSLFHIDVTFKTRWRLRKLPHSIFTFELKSNALVLKGPDVLNLVPQVTLSNLNWGDTNEILLRRLWAIMLSMPDSFAFGRESGLSEKVISYLIARNALDLTTVLLPYQGVLLPTYTERVEYLVKHGLGEKLQFLGPDFIPFMKRCLEEKLSLEFDEPPRESYPRLITYLEKALHFVGLNTENPGSAPSPFNEWPWTPRQRIHLLKALKRLATRLTPLEIIEWLRKPRKAIRAAGMLEAHRALVAWIQGDRPRAEEAIARSWQLLEHLMPDRARELRAEASTSSTQRLDFPYRWLKLRQRWKDYWIYYYRITE